MDTFIKKHSLKYINTNNIIQNQKLHAIGVTSMFIASKYEDIFPIPLKDFATSISHNAFSVLYIKSVEKDILEMLDYNINVPTIY